MIALIISLAAENVRVHVHQTGEKKFSGTVDALSVVWNFNLIDLANRFDDVAFDEYRRSGHRRLIRGVDDDGVREGDWLDLREDGNRRLEIEKKKK